jgi:hypothetical protein
MKEPNTNSKSGTILFDQAKARQTIYSILMGLTLKSFVERAVELSKKGVFLHTLPTTIYCIILLCFLINCFRYLFALAQFANMTNEGYLPNEDDWRPGKILRNLGKIFVLNNGVLSLIVFGVSVFYIFPDSEVIELDSMTLHYLIMVFINTFLGLNFLCLATLFVYRRTKPKDLSGINQGISATDLRVWDITCVIELLILGFLYFVNCEHNIRFHLPYLNLTLASLLTFIAFFETIGGFRYFSKQAEFIDKHITKIEDVIGNATVDVIKFPFRLLFRKKEPNNA